MFTDRDDKHACLSTNWVSMYHHTCAQWFDDTCFYPRVKVSLKVKTGLTKIKEFYTLCVCVHVHAQCRVDDVGPGYLQPFVKKPRTVLGSLLPASWTHEPGSSCFLDRNSFPPQAIYSGVVLSKGSKVDSAVPNIKDLSNTSPECNKKAFTACWLYQYKCG